MSLPTPFCPVDRATGALIAGKTVKTSADFGAFVHWLTLHSEEELRKTAYALIDGKEATMVAKATLIDSVCGAYVKDLLRKANLAAAAALSIDAEAPDAERAQTGVGRARGELKSFKEAIQAELFAGQMRKSSMSDEAIDRLVGAFDGLNNMAKDVAVMLADAARLIKEKEAHTLPEAMRSFLESKERRADVKRLGDGDGEGADDRLGLFAPLLRYIETIELPKAKAEMLAHLEDYVRSGWFAQDIVEGTTGPGCELGSWWGARHDGAGPLREAFAKIQTGQRVEDHVIGALFERRVAELAVGVKTVKGPAPKKGIHGAEAPWVVSETFAIEPDHLFSSNAASGVIDSFWISPDSSRYFITCATSSDTLSTQNNQMARYVEATEDAVKKGLLGVHRIPCAPAHIHARTLAVCGAQAKGPRSVGVQAGSSMLACFQPGSPAQERALVAHLNALPFACMLAKDPKFTPETYSRYELNLIGDTETVWTPLAKAAAQGNDSDADRFASGVALMAGFLGGLGSLMATQPLKELSFGSTPGGIGEKAFCMVKNILQLVRAVNKQSSLVEPDHLARVHKALEPGIAPLIGALSRVIPRGSEEEDMHELALSALRDIQAKASASNKKTKKTRKRA